MAASTGIQLAQGIRKRIEELKKLCEGVDESAASCAPAGRWSPEEILSHLLGPEETGHLSMLQAFLDRETPLIDIEPENPFFTGKRARMTFDQLLAEVERQYGRIAKFAAGLPWACPGNSSTGRRIFPCSKNRRLENTRRSKPGSACSGVQMSLILNFTSTTCVRYCRVSPHGQSEMGVYACAPFRLHGCISFAVDGKNPFAEIEGGFRFF